jgi:hypothetical protein
MMKMAANGSFGTERDVKYVLACFMSKGKKVVVESEAT